MKISKKINRRSNLTPGGTRAASNPWRRLKWKCAILLAAGLVLTTVLASVSHAQGTRSGSTTKGFLLFGDVKVDESRLAGEKPQILELILYTKGMMVVARQRINPGGRYRFMDIYDGDYWLVLELEGVEVARDSVFIAKSMTMDIRHDINMEWRSTGGRSGSAGVVSAAALYNRSASNKSLYEKSAKEIEGKNYPQAIATLRDLVASDPNDFPAWSDLGMLYFVQKDYEAAENCYASALKAKPEYFPAMFNLGKVQLARKSYEQAIASLEAALKIEPKSAPANYFLGEAYLGIKKGSKAVVYLNEALKIDPVGMADAHLRLGALYNGAGMKDKAVVEYEQFLAKKPDYSDRQKLEKYIADNKKP
jgi:Tfp pilus assembly protein PilF